MLKGNPVFFGGKKKAIFIKKWPPEIQSMNNRSVLQNVDVNDR